MINYRALFTELSQPENTKEVAFSFDGENIEKIVRRANDLILAKIKNCEQSSQGQKRSYSVILEKEFAEIAMYDLIVEADIRFFDKSENLEAIETPSLQALAKNLKHMWFVRHANQILRDNVCALTHFKYPNGDSVRLFIIPDQSVSDRGATMKYLMYSQVEAIPTHTLEKFRFCVEQCGAMMDENEIVSKEGTLEQRVYSVAKACEHAVAQCVKNIKD